MIEVLHTRHPGILLNISRIGDVQKLLAVCADKVADMTVDVFGPDLLGPDPVRSVIGSILLIKRRAVNAVGKSLEDQRTILEVRNQVTRDFLVVVDEIAFSVSVFGPENFIEIGELYSILPRRLASLPALRGRP